MFFTYLLSNLAKPTCDHKELRLTIPSSSVPSLAYSVFAIAPDF
jgi:hypothetical protein